MRPGTSSGKNVLTNHQYELIKEFNKREDVTVHKDDKSSTFIIMSTGKYAQKLDELLSDTSKFKKSKMTPPKS